MKCNPASRISLPYLISEQTDHSTIFNCRHFCIGYTVFLIFNNFTGKLMDIQQKKIIPTSSSNLLISFALFILTHRFDNKLHKVGKESVSWKMLKDAENQAFKLIPTLVRQECFLFLICFLQVSQISMQIYISMTQYKPEFY